MSLIEVKLFPIVSPDIFYVGESAEHLLIKFTTFASFNVIVATLIHISDLDCYDLFNCDR